MRILIAAAAMAAALPLPPLAQQQAPAVFPAQGTLLEVVADVRTARRLGDHSDVSVSCSGCRSPIGDGEMSHSGLVRPPAKRVGDKTPRGFKSRRLRT